MLRFGCVGTSFEGLLPLLWGMHAIVHYIFHADALCTHARASRKYNPCTSSALCGLSFLAIHREAENPERGVTRH